MSPDPYSILQQLSARPTPQLLVVTGAIESGKTTWCEQFVTTAQQQGYRVGGVLSPAVFENQQKIGINVRNILTGEQQALAKRRTADSGLTTKRWAFNPSVVDWVDGLLQHTPPCDIFLIDELGPLEFERQQGFVAGLQRIDTLRDPIACVVIRQSLLSVALERWSNRAIVQVDI